MDAVVQLSQHPNIVGIKDSGGDVRATFILLLFFIYLLNNMFGLRNQSVNSVVP